jgi:hypothetical protein
LVQLSSSTTAISDRVALALRQLHYEEFGEWYFVIFIDWRNWWPRGQARLWSGQG